MSKMIENFKTKLTRVKTFLFDVDGVLTDGSIGLLPTGEQVRTMNTKDGYALQLAIKKGYRIAIITGGKSESVRIRLNGLGITDVYLGIQNKLDVYKEYIEIHRLNPDDILYMGDDIPDYEVMQRVGIPTCPHDSAPEIKALCIYVSDKKGGEGCVRDVIEQVMKVQGTWKISSAIQSI
jgi:3-deoxy-D-manno-octulosonate 8-phosphate phosphatase (KDO 8-P phosphatase)